MREDHGLAVGTTSFGPPGAIAVHETMNITTFVNMVPMSGGVAKSFAEIEQFDLEAWKKVPGAERVLAIWSLTSEAHTFAGNDGPLPRLQRSVGGVRPR